MSNVAATVEPGGIARETMGRWLAYGGVALGVVAFWTAVPPVTARSPLVPLVIGLLGAAAGIGAISLGASVSKLLLARHWTSDVVGGYLAGIAWGATCAGCYELGRKRDLRVS